jgi:acetyl esterase
MTADSLPFRARVFGAVLKAIARPPTNAAEMIELRQRRGRMLSTAVGQYVVGRDAAGVSVRDISGPVRLRVHTPGDLPGAAPVVVNYHGGGWCLGAPEQSRWLASRVAARVGAVVVSPAYRLAPEHPFPAGVDDAWAALQWVHDHAAELGGDPDRIAVMGDSAGGNLATVVALRARDHAGPLLRADWQASPIRATDHAGLPPALILTAGHDPLHDHGTRYADVLRLAGVPVELINHPRAIHGFMSLRGIVPSASEGLDQIAGFLDTAFREAPSRQS